MAQPSLAWLTTTLADRAGLEQLRFEVVGALAGSANQITVVAAYWDPAYLKRLLTAIPPARRSKVAVRVFVNGFTGRRGTDDAALLADIVSAWRKRGLRNLTIGLVTGSRLFHSKVLVFEGPKAVSVLVGSANATEAAFTDNEELMLMLGSSAVPKGLRQYLDAVAAGATPIDQVVPYEAHNLPAFFRGGDVYYRPTIVTSFRFDLRLPAAMRTAMTRLQVAIAGITARAGQTYDPFAKVGLSAVEERELAEASSGDEGEAAGGSRVSLRSYGVETCYGWWVPGAYHELLEEKLAPARAKRAALLSRLAHLLDHNGEAVRRLAIERFAQLEAYAVQERFVLTESTEQRIERFDALLERATNRLADLRWRRRAEEPYVRASVPEIWSDPTSSGEFMDSFFDYLELIATTKKRPTVWRSLTDRIPALEGASSSDEIRDALKAYLSRRGWGQGDWAPVSTHA